jgi:hypothetical protein
MLWRVLLGPDTCGDWHKNKQKQPQDHFLRSN